MFADSPDEEGRARAARNRAGGQIRAMRAFLIALGLSAAALADHSSRPAASAEPSSRSAAQPGRTAAEQLVRQVIPREQYAAMIDQMSTQAMNGMKQQGMRVSTDEAQRFHAAMAEALPYDELVQISARIYADHFTEGEIGDVLAFYKTPTGTKFTREIPGIMGDSMRETTRIIQTRIPALLAKHGLGPSQKESQPSAASAKESQPSAATGKESQPSAASAKESQPSAATGK
jgi:uncharacterized protein